MTQHDNKLFLVLIFVSFAFVSTATASNKNLNTVPFESYEQIQTLTQDFFCSKGKHGTVQKELKGILEADQEDRMTSNPEMGANDIKRRIRVAEIAAEACLKSKGDYFAAALIFQHGVKSEHYLQAALYAAKSTTLGHMQGTALQMAAIDRYLMSLGHKQVFGTQISSPAFYKSVESDEDMASCLWPIDDTINFVDDYDIGTREFKESLREDILLKKKQFPDVIFRPVDPRNFCRHFLKSKYDLPRLSRNFCVIIVYEVSPNALFSASLNQKHHLWIFEIRF